MSNKKSEKEVQQWEKKVVARFKQLPNKTKVADEFGISPRTLGRILERSKVGKAVVESVATAPAVKAKKVKKVVVDKSTGTIALNENIIDQAAKSVGTETRYRYFFIIENDLINATRIDTLRIDPVLNEVADRVSNPKFDEIVKLHAEQAFEEAFGLMSFSAALETLYSGDVKFDPKVGKLVYDDGVNTFTFVHTISDRILELLQQGGNTNGLMKFAERLAHNPSAVAVAGLYDFLKANDVEIDDEGFVICYKKVRSNYKDCHSGKFDNSVGQVVSMPRHMVVDDPRTTCAAGLHVCSKSYLAHFGGERIMKAKVDPRDFVSVPHDYYKVESGGTVKAKARVCRYEIVAEITN